MERQGSVANFGRRYTRNANVNGLSLHVLAVQRDAAAMPAKIIIAPWRAIPADDINRSVGVAEADHQIMKQVEFFQVVIFHVSSAMVAEKMIEVRHGIRKVTVANPIHDVDVLSGVQMVEPEAILLGRNGL